MHCTECGAELEADQKFCGACGHASSSVPSQRNVPSFGRELFRVPAQRISAESLAEDHPIRLLTSGLCDIVATDTSISIARTPQSNSKVGGAVKSASLLLGPVAAIVTSAITSSVERAAADHKNPSHNLSELTYKEMLSSGSAAVLPKDMLRIVDVQIKASIFDGIEHYIIRGQNIYQRVRVQGQSYSRRSLCFRSPTGHASPS